MNGRARREKGARGEREFAAELSKHLGVTCHRELGAARDGGQDLCVEGWAIEVKRQEILQLPVWWAQACSQALERNLLPALAYRMSRHPWRVIVPLDVIQCGYWRWRKESLEWAAQLSIAGFAAVVRES